MTQSDPEDPIAVNALLPLFSEKCATIAMVKQGMECLKQITNLPNANQTPVTVFDQPLFALLSMCSGLGHSLLENSVLLLC